MAIGAEIVFQESLRMYLAKSSKSTIWKKNMPDTWFLVENRVRPLVMMSHGMIELLSGRLAIQSRK